MLKLVNYNSEVKTLLIQGPPMELIPNESYSAKIASENLTAKTIKTKKGDNLQIIEALVVVDKYKPFKATLLTQTANEFSQKTIGDDISVFIKFDGTYRNASI